MTPPRLGPPVTSEARNNRLERDTEDLGVVRLCTWCGEEWPRDEEFWYIDKRGWVVGRCRACWVDFNRSRRWRYPRVAA